MVECIVCKRDIEFEGYFTEDGNVYCERDYAEKRFKEVDEKTKAEWLRVTLATIKAEVRLVKPERKKVIIEKWKSRIPKDWEAEVDKL